MVTPPGPHPYARVPGNVWLVGQEGTDRQRGGRYSLESVRAHPGKMLPALARRLVREYTRPGGRVLDPMSGIGTTGVEAARLGRDYVGVELEERFARLQRENLAQVTREPGAGRAAVVRGDARRLTACLPPDALPFDAVLTSPPYADRLQAGRGSGSALVQEWLRDGVVSGSFVPGSYGTGPTNLGNLAGEAFLREMRRVWEGCLAVLRPGGLLVVVQQPERRHRLLQPVHHETARACRELGFELLDEVLAVLGRVRVGPDGQPELVAHASFWRRLHARHLREQGWPVSLGQAEHVLVFRKPDAPPAPETQKRPSGRPCPPAARRGACK